MSIAESGMRRAGKYTLAGPNDSISALPDMRRTSRYFATEFLLMFILCAMSVTVIPLGFSLRIVLMLSSSFW